MHRKAGTKYDAIGEERRWWDKPAEQAQAAKEIHPLPARHHFAYECVRLNWQADLLTLGCNASSTVLEAGCGSGEDAAYVRKITNNIVGVDVSATALRGFKANGFQGFLADVLKLPFADGSFDFVLCSGLLHHLVGQGKLDKYVAEFARVTKPGGQVVVLEPNAFHPSGMLMNIFNTIKPGITGLVPHERALCPYHLTGALRGAGLRDIRLAAASYAWNRMPLGVSKFIAARERRIRTMKPFSYFGWFLVVSGRKAGAA